MLKNKFFNFFVLNLAILSLGSCGDRDLSRTYSFESKPFSSNLFAVAKTEDGFHGYLNFFDQQVYDLKLNLRSKRLSLSKVSEGLISCLDERCEVNWLSPEPADPERLSAIDIIKRDFRIEIETLDINFFVNENPSIESIEVKCDESFGDINGGEKISVSLLYKDQIVSTSFIYQLSDPNNSGTLPIKSEALLRTEAKYYLDFDTYFSDPDQLTFKHKGSRRTVGENSFFLIDADHSSHSKSIRVCVND